jgi:hypothetical protein
MNQKTPCLQMLSWKLHVRKSMSPRKSAFRVFITPSILNKNGGDRLRKTSISSIFEEEILENCRFWKVQTSGFGLCIIYPNYLSCFKVVPEPGQRNSFSKRLFVPQNTAYICIIMIVVYKYILKNNLSKQEGFSFPDCMIYFPLAGYKTQKQCGCELWCFLTKQETSTIKL